MAIEIVVAGTSTGGLNALVTLLEGLPPGFPLPVAVVQHRAPYSDETLVRLLRRHTPLKVREPRDKESIAPGRIYLAPAEYHLLVEPGAFALSTEGPVSFARPSIDVLFESAADAYREKALAVALTSASSDGARGAARIKARGGLVVVQDPATAESPILPKAVIAATAVDAVLPLPEISAFLSFHAPRSPQSQHPARG